MYQYSILLEIHPIVANAWKNRAVRSAVIGGTVGGTVNKMRGGSFTKGALVGGAVGVAGNGIYQTAKAQNAVSKLKNTQNKAQDMINSLEAKRRRLRSPKSLEKIDELISKQKNKLNRSFNVQFKRDQTAKALRDARRAGDKEALYKIVSQSQDVMNNPQRLIKGANLKAARDSGYIASLRKNRI